MAIPEACQLWIEQRIEEEIQEQDETGKSLRAIGREIAKEIEKYFKTKVKPNTIKERARRMKSGINVPLDATHNNNSETHGNQKIKTHGGKREGAGRKPKTQKNAWKNVEIKLRKLIEYIENNCEVPAEITIETRHSIENHIRTLTIFKKEM